MSTSAVPTHETVNAAGATENFRARSQQQMISVCEENLGAGFLERAGQLRLHRGLRADRHEERCLHFVMQSAKGRGPSARIESPARRDESLGGNESWNAGAYFYHPECE